MGCLLSGDSGVALALLPGLPTALWCRSDRLAGELRSDKALWGLGLGESPVFLLSGPQGQPPWGVGVGGECLPAVRYASRISPPSLSQLLVPASAGLWGLRCGEVRVFMAPAPPCQTPSAGVVLRWACIEVTNGDGQVSSVLLEYGLELPASVSASWRGREEQVCDKALAGPCFVLCPARELPHLLASARNACKAPREAWPQAGGRLLPRATLVRVCQCPMLPFTS